MSAEQSNQNMKERAAVENRILLLADDGRIAQLMERLKDKYSISNESNVFAGIAQLGLTPYQVVFLNAQRLQDNTIQAVKALRRVNQNVPIYLYGEAFAEVYARPALKVGAGDFLVWPIPAEEIKAILNTIDSKHPRQDENSLHDKSCPTSAGRINDQEHRTARANSAKNAFEIYQQLAQCVWRGTSYLVEQAQSLLPELLQVTWVKVYTHDAQKKTAVKERITRAEKAIPLNGPFGNVGQLVLGEPIQSNQNIPADETAMYLATLVHLAQRDETLKHLATIDELTGAHNRRYLEYFLRQVIIQSSQEPTEMTLLLFDIDNFKHYNDAYGHGAGDEILRQAIKMIRRCCREHDVVARFGGDEFCVLFWDTRYRRIPYRRDEDEENASVIAKGKAGNLSGPLKSHPEMAMFMSNRFRRMMMTREFPSLGPAVKKGVLTISGGLACYPWDGKTAEELIHAADEALLNAKRSGKNRIYLVGRPHENK